MSKRFFIYDNGNSVFNIDHIVRIYVAKGCDTKGNDKLEYKVVVIDCWFYDITKEEYTKLIEFIKEMDGA